MLTEFHSHDHPDKTKYIDEAKAYLDQLRHLPPSDDPTLDIDFLAERIRNAEVEVARQIADFTATNDNDDDEDIEGKQFSRDSALGTSIVSGSKQTSSSITGTDLSSFAKAGPLSVRSDDDASTVVPGKWNANDTNSEASFTLRPRSGPTESSASDSLNGTGTKDGTSTGTPANANP